MTSRELPAGEKGFIGGTDDSATGLTNLGAREYQPLSGSFVSPDPMQYAYDPQDLNAYSYATDNPTTLSDPSGASPVIPGPVRIPEPILTGSTGATPTDVPGDQINGPHGCKGSTVQEVLDCEHTVLENDWKIIWSNYKKRLGLVWDCSMITPPPGVNCKAFEQTVAKDKKIALCAKNPKCPQQQADIPIVEKLQEKITPCDGPNPKPQSCNPQLTKPHFGGLLAGLIAAVFFHIDGI